MFSFYIARRYLFSKKKYNTINIISIISICGVALATMAMVVTLSVFNGFQDLVAHFFTAFDPQLKLTLVQGTVVAADDSALVVLHNHPAVEVATDVLEDQALIVAENRQWVVNIKGVDATYSEQSRLRDALYGDGDYSLLNATYIDYGIMGIRLASSLGLGTYYEGAIPIWAPRRGEKINMTNPMQNFNHEDLYSPGVVFAVNQIKYDGQYIVTSIGFARRLFDQQGMVSAVELRLREDADVDKVQHELQALLGERFLVQNRYEQQEDTFRIMQVEKFIAYVFLTFILLVASFNIVGGLSMLMIDKREDMLTLRSLGATDRQVSQIFVLEGWLISGFGALIGIVVGLFVCYLQQELGIVKLGETAGAFIVEAYPVSIHIADILLVFLTVLIVGLVAVWLPVKYMTSHSIYKKEDMSVVSTHPL
ncbi:MAG: ABC transporter permease [Bacteroidaceae bacterium]|nr:ABC transporter permease [Bacteroidaceae bacterium]